MSAASSSILVDSFFISLQSRVLTEQEEFSIMAPLNVCMVGTGEYTTGFVGGGASGSDKKVGVVGALILFVSKDLTNT